MTIRNTAYQILEKGQRTNQEDSLFPALSVRPVSEDCYILCDGMGGHSAGEVASGTVCETMGRHVREHPRADGYFEELDFQKALDAAFDALDLLDDGAERKMGTTLTFIKFHKGGCFVAHIGDSRIYQIRPSDQQVVFVTHDHSLVNDLIKLGELTPEQAKTSSQKNIITRAVQPHQERRASADCINLTDIRPGDYFFLCSDGMLENAEDAELVNILSMDRPDEEKIKILRGATQENRDNHSAFLVHVDAVEGNVPEPVASEAVAPAVAVPMETKPAPRRIWIYVVSFLVLLLLATLYIVYHIRTK